MARDVSIYKKVEKYMEVGMKMGDIKLPMMIARTSGTETKAETNISASALYKYLGWSKSRRTGTNATSGVAKNGVPLLMYLDIFKNFFANTQEDKFYMLKGIDNKIKISEKEYNVPFSNKWNSNRCKNKHFGISIVQVSWVEQFKKNRSKCKYRSTKKWSSSTYVS